MREIVQLFSKEEFSLAYMANAAYDERELNLWLDEIQDTLTGTGFEFVPKNGSVWGPNNGMTADEFHDLFWDAHMRVVDCNLAEDELITANMRDRYPRDWFTRIVPEVIERAGRHCERCGAEHGRGDLYGVPVTLTILHRNGDVADNRPENLAALCQRCRLKFDRDRHCEGYSWLKEAGHDKP